MDEPPNHKCRWYQFSPRSLMIVVTVLALPLGYVGCAVTSGHVDGVELSRCKTLAP